MKKVHLGCGNEILEGYINHDVAALPGVDVVHDLRCFPWPFSDNEINEVVVRHVLEHLPNTIEVLEELWRICANGAKISIRVPYWNSMDFATDPTHARAFSECSFDYFDPDKKACKERFYYSKARFKITQLYYFTRVFGKYIPIKSKILCYMLQVLAHYLCNVIRVIEFELRVIK